jgi:AcrR family transcriptional regulator
MATRSSSPRRSPVVAPPRQRMTSEKRRAAIVEAAVHLFARNGFRGTTIRQLAAAVGVSEPVLYMHFQTKRDLYTAILEKLAKTGPDPGCLCVADPKAVDDRKFFLQLANAIVDWHEKDPDLMRVLFYSLLEGHELADLFYRQHIAPFMEAFGGYIQQRIKDGAFRKVEPSLAARAFVGMIGHYAKEVSLFQFDSKLPPRKKTLETMVEIFLNGVKK